MLSIQDPTYASSMRLGEALLNACKKSTNGAGAFAFAEETGIDLFLGDKIFTSFIKKNKFELIVGTDSITDPKAVARLREYCKKYKNLTVYGYVHDPRKYLFHPKTVWFETSTGGLSIVGSGNLTERGLFHNVEMYSFEALNKADFNNSKKEWQDWIDFSISNNLIFEINDPIIDHAVNLSASKKATAFSKPKGSKTTSTTPSTALSTLYSKQPKAVSVPKKKRTTTSKSKTVKPKKASTVIASPVPAVAPIVVNPIPNPVWTVNLTDRVLVAEIPKGDKRWGQANFDKRSFQQYFGATPGGAAGTYLILLKSVDSAGNLGQTETRPSVSVASHNWRFEISAAKGLTYPSGSQRPYILFSEAATRSFLYELIMPGDPRYNEVDNYMIAWKKAHKKSGLARVITSVNAIKPSTPTLGMWKV